MGTMRRFMLLFRRYGVAVEPVCRGMNSLVGKWVVDDGAGQTMSIRGEIFL